MNTTSFYNNKKNGATERPLLNPELYEYSDVSSESDESINVSEIESDYENDSESNSSESNNKPLVKPNPSPQSKTETSKKEN